MGLVACNISFRVVNFVKIYGSWNFRKGKGPHQRYGKKRQAKSSQKKSEGDYES